MKKNLYLMMLALISVMFTMTSCHGVMPDADEESVLIYKPWFFGHGGVDESPVQTGCTWCVWTTSSETFKIVPQKYTEAFDDIFSNDNTPLDFNTNLIITIKAGHTPALYKNYGIHWYENNIQEVYRNLTRDQVSKYSPFDLTSNREVLAQIDADVKAALEKHIEKLSKDKEFPIIINQVITGKATPNKAQLDEMNRTAAAIQAAKTQERKKEMEVARADAEKARAIADKTYMNEMSLSPSQFIQIKYIEMIDKKQGANIDVLIGGNAEQMWNVRR